MPFTIHPIDPTLDGTALAIATVMVSSRWSDVHWRNLFEPGTTENEAIEANAARVPWNLISNRVAKREQIVVDEVTGEIVAYCRWVLPDSLVAAEAKGETVVWQEAQVKEVDEEQKKVYEMLRKGGLDEQGRFKYIRHDLLDDRSTPLEQEDAQIRDEQGEMLDLDYLSTKPSAQRQGIGAMLLEKGLDIADKYGLKTFVTASPIGLSLYLKHGFKVVRTMRRDYSRFIGDGTEELVSVDHFMIRQPRDVAVA